MRCAVSERARPTTASGCGSWSGALAAAGIELVVVRPASNRGLLHRQLDGVSAVLLPDGTSGGGPGDDPGDAGDPGLDRIERELVRFARARGLPVVGIGCGAGFLVRYFGGRLVARAATTAADGPVELRFVPGRGPESARVRPAGRLVCDPETLPSGLCAIAFDEHDQIAGFVHRTEPILAVHWQPVDPDDGATRLVLDALRPAARGTPTVFTES